MAEGSIAKIDLVLQELGPMGRFQVIQCCIFFLSYLNDAYQFFTYIFIGQAVSHTCAPPNNDSDWIIPELHGASDNVTTVLYDKCNIIVIKNISDDLTIIRYPCVYGMTYEGDYYRSFVSDFDLVCDHASLPALSQTVINIGLGLGCIIVPSLSDRYGRKRLLIIAQMFMLSGGIMAGLAPTYLVFLLARFITGFFAAGVGLTAVTAGIEVFPSSHRKLASGFGSTLWWSICIMSLVPWAYLLRDYSWRTLQLAVCGSFSIGILQIVLLYEPLRWLAVNGKMKQALKLLKTACRWNKKDYRKILAVFLNVKAVRHEVLGSEKPVNGVVHVQKDPKEVDDCDSNLFFATAVDSVNSVTNAPEAGVQKLTWKDLLMHRRLRINVICNWVIWVVNSLTYGALYLMTDILATSLYTGLFLNALVEGASCLLIVVTVDRFGRKKSVAGFHAITGLSLIISSICFSFQELSALQIVATVFSLLGKFGVSASFNTLFMYTPEIFPTNVRNLALGSCYGASTVGGMIAPFAGILARYALWAPGALFGTCNLLVLILLRFLPETMGKELPQTVEDVKRRNQAELMDPRTKVFKQAFAVI